MLKASCLHKGVFGGRIFHGHCQIFRLGRKDGAKDFSLIGAVGAEDLRARSLSLGKPRPLAEVFSNTKNDFCILACHTREQSASEKHNVLCDDCAGTTASANMDQTLINCVHPSV